jgi:ParB-like chromosome segregation protein Spo0J
VNIKDLAQGRRDMFMLDPRILVEQPGFNLREEGPELDEYVNALAEFIFNNGVPGVLTVHMQGDDPVVIDGHCRRRATMIAIKKGAEIKSVPCRLTDKYANEVDRIAHLITSNSGRQLSPIEKAGVVKRLRAFNMGNKEIAVKLGMTVSYIGQLLELCGAPVEVTDMVKRGEVSATTAVQEVRKSPEQATNRLKDAVTRAKAAGKKKATKKHLAPSPAKARPAMSIEAIKKAIDKLDKDDLTEILHYVRAKM